MYRTFERVFATMSGARDRVEKKEQQQEDEQQVYRPSPSYRRVYLTAAPIEVSPRASARGPYNNGQLRAIRVDVFSKLAALSLIDFTELVSTQTRLFGALVV